jgi:hypothetical protein
VARAKWVWTAGLALSMAMSSMRELVVGGSIGSDEFDFNTGKARFGLPECAKSIPGGGGIIK